MKQAKSMYYGGEIISAEECDYSSSKNLGLKCPFCNEAVFLRATSERETTLRNGATATQVITAHFAHYPISKYGIICEKRALSSEGKALLEKARIEVRNQRLSLYNKYLWQMFVEDRNLKEKKLKIVTQKYGQTNIEKMVSLVQLELNHILSYYYTNAAHPLLTIKPYIAHDLNDLKEIAKEGKSEIGLLVPKNKLKDEMDSFYDYFSKADLNFHESVSKEILQYLGTRTAKQSIIWLTKTALYTMLLVGDNVAFKTVTPHMVAMFILMLVRSTHWQKQIEMRLNKN